MTRSIRLVRVALLGAGLLLVSCGQTPQETEQARGFLSGTNVVLALTVVFLVVAGGLLLGAVAVDRAIKSRSALVGVSAAPPEEEIEEVVAGIGVGNAPVPRWLYGFYVVIPVFAMLYVFNSVALAPAKPAKPAATATPTGPTATPSIVAKSISWSVPTLQVPANKSVTVTADNEDTGIPHTFTVWKSEADATVANASGKIADTGQFTGVSTKTVTFTVAPGKYFFDCTVHPSMKGAIEAVAK